MHATKFVARAVVIALCAASCGQPPASSAADVPDYVPMMPGAFRISSQASSDKNVAGGHVVFTVNNSPAGVIAFYKKKLIADGFRENSEMTNVFVVEKGDVMVEVTATNDAAGSEAQVTWTKLLKPLAVAPR